MNSFAFFNPVKVIFGAGEVRRAGEEARLLGKRALLVSYQDISFFNGLPQQVEAFLAEAGITCATALIVTANPKLSEAKEGIKIGKANEVDLVIGLGGGSAMDLAKVIAAGILYPHDLARMICFTHSEAGYQISPKAALPMMMIPTLPVTTSEMNPTAVITDEATSRKSYVWEPACLYPKTAILDPALTITLPAYQTACGAIDAISHAIEPLFFSDEATFGNIDLQSQMQMGVIRAIYQNLPKVLANPTDLQLRGMMQWSATVGLNGWLTCGVQGWTPMHQMGHVLSSHFKATHGAMLACMILAWMRFFADRKDNARFRLFAQSLFGTEDLLKAADTFEAYIRSVGVQSRIGGFGCTQRDLDTLTDGLVRVSFGRTKSWQASPKLIGMRPGKFTPLRCEA